MSLPGRFERLRGEPAPHGRRGTGVLLPLLLIATVFVVAPDARAAPPVKVKVQGQVSMLSDTQDQFGQGLPRLFYSPGNAQIKVTTTKSKVHVFLTGGTRSESIYMWIEAPYRKALHTGHYEESQLPSSPNVGMSGDTQDCGGTSFGSFDVLQLDKQADGTIANLHVTFVMYCTTNDPLDALYGEIQLTRNGQLAQPLLAPSQVVVPDVFTGGSSSVQPVWLVNTGSSDLPVSAVTMGGPQSADFQLRLDECSGQVLLPGAICRAWFRFVPADPGPDFGSLDITAGGHNLTAQLAGTLRAGTTGLTLHSDPGDYLGHGGDYAYDTGNSRFQFLGSLSTSMHFTVVGDDGHTFDGYGFPPNGETWAVGTYPTSGGDPSGASWDLSVDYHSCGQSGTLTIDSLQANPDGRIVSIDLNFDTYCYPDSAGLHGTFELAAPTPDPPPGAVQAVHVSRTGTTAAVTWANPPDADLARVVVAWRRGTSPVARPTAGQLGSAILATSASLTGLPAGTPISLELWTVDASGNAGPGVSVQVAS